MVLVFAVGLCASIAAAHSPFAETVARVNSILDAGWTAAIPSQFTSRDDVAKLCGARNDNRVPASKPPIKTDLPEDFDSRTSWPNCTIIGKVGSQAGCGDCWAWSATQVFESALCIKGLLPTDMVLSKQDTAECCSGALCGYSKSCTAGTPSSALLWMSMRGVVTGGAFNSSMGCKPYSLAPCSVDPTDPNDPLSPCHEPKPPPALTCEPRCSNAKYATPYQQDKRGANAGFQMSGLSYRDDNQTHAMAHLVSHGPITATFTVMGDFPTYRSGIYTHVTGQALGGHAVTIVGYGVDNGVKYWTVKNSWSQYWGHQGYFRIRRGTDECGIESHLTGLIKG